MKKKRVSSYLNAPLFSEKPDTRQSGFAFRYKRTITGGEVYVYGSRLTRAECAKVFKKYPSVGRIDNNGVTLREEFENPHLWESIW